VSATANQRHSWIALTIVVLNFGTPAVLYLPLVLHGFSTPQLRAFPFVIAHFALGATSAILADRFRRLSAVPPGAKIPLGMLPWVILRIVAFVGSVSFLFMGFAAFTAGNLCCPTPVGD